MFFDPPDDRKFRSLRRVEFRVPVVANNPARGHDKRPAHHGDARDVVLVCRGKSGRPVSGRCGAVVSLARNLAADGGRESAASEAALGDLAANVSGADVQERRGYEADAGRQGAGDGGNAGTRIDEDVVVVEYLLAVFPLRKAVPVVGADDEREAALGMEPAEMGQRRHHVGGTREVHLDVANRQAGVGRRGQLGEVEPDVVGEQVGTALLERIERRDDEPQFVYLAQTQQMAGKGNVARVDRVEGTAEDARAERSVGGGGMKG